MKPKTALQQDLLRRATLERTGFMGPLFGSDEFFRARFFIEKMESYIESSEAAEVTELETRTVALSDDEKQDFWSWNYPIHWEDIFGTRIRSALCIQICSHVEAVLGDVAHRVKVIERCGAPKRPDSGSMLEKHLAFLTTKANFGQPSALQWERMGYISKIRNIFVHSQGHNNKYSEDLKFTQFLSHLPHVGLEHDFIELKAGSCTAILEIAEQFCKSLRDEYEAYRKRSLALEHTSEN